MFSLKSKLVLLERLLLKNRLAGANMGFRKFFTGIKFFPFQLYGLPA